MSIKSEIHIILLGAALLAIGFACKKSVEIPVLASFPVTYISEVSVTCYGNVTDDGGESASEMGICWGTSHNPTTANDKIVWGSGSGAYTCTLTALSTNTQYYARAYAINSAGTGYGEEVSFRTWNSGTVSDIDGNSYHTVTIGAQVWMVENLKTSRYRDGTFIPQVSGDAEWEGLTSGADCFYANDPQMVAIYGILYNWFAVNDSRKLAPAGWHIPSDAEWSALEDYLGGEGVAGGKLKEAGYGHWLTPNDGATNETGFSALPGGHREYGGNYDSIRWGGGWWTATDDNPNDAWIRYMDHGNRDSWSYLEDKRYGRSVRCIRD